jgi:F0F1-type ATP synthase assembly protein I
LALVAVGILVQVGFLTVVILFVALGGGLLLDTHFNTRPLFTLLLVVGSIPVTVYLLFRIVLSGTKNLQQANRPHQNENSGEQEETEGGENP